MADNITLNTGTGGQVVRALDDGTVVYPVGLSAYPTTVGTPDVVQLVDLTHGLPVVQETGSIWNVTALGQYSEGDFEPSSDGHVMLWKAAGDILRAVSETNLLPVRATQTGIWNIADNGGSLTVDNGGTFAVQATQSGTWNIGTVTTVTTVGAVTAITNALPEGTNSIGKLGANSGIDIGDVDVTSVIPGTGATNLGKAIDSIAGSTDTGVAVLAKHSNEAMTLTAEGDYDVLRIDSRGALHASPEQHLAFDTFNATTGWTALGNDTLNLATTTKHIQGTAALTFDKVNGAANTVFAGIQKTITSINLGDVAAHDLLQGAFYIADISNVSYVFLRLGTDSSNYNEWRIPDTNITQATFVTASQNVGDANYAGITGNGWDSSAITYIAVGVAFDSESNTLAGIVFDEVSYHTNLHTAASSSLEVNSSVTTPNINMHRVGGIATATNAGANSNGVLRVTIATDDAAITALQLIDDTVATLGTTTYTETTTKGLTIGAVRRDADTTLVNTTNEIGPLQMDANGRLKVEAFSGETLPVSLASVPSHAVTNAGTFAVQNTPAKASTATLANVSSSATSVTLQASNANRIGLNIFNDSTQVLYVKFGATASATSFVVKIAAGGFYEMPSPIYTGIVDGIWASANGSARMTELT